MVRQLMRLLPLLPDRFATAASIRLRRTGCVNRPFYQIGVCAQSRWRRDLPFNEVLGNFDPMPNERDEKLVGLDMERFCYWLGQGAQLSPEVADLLGYCGVTPITPAVLEKAYRNRIAGPDGEKKKSEESSSV